MDSLLIKHERKGNKMLQQCMCIIWHLHLSAIDFSDEISPSPTGTQTGIAACAPLGHI